MLELEFVQLLLCSVIFDFFKGDFGGVEAVSFEVVIVSFEFVVVLLESTSIGSLFLDEFFVLALHLAEFFYLLDGQVVESLLLLDEKLVELVLGLFSSTSLYRGKLQLVLGNQFFYLVLGLLLQL